MVDNLKPKVCELYVRILGVKLGVNLGENILVHNSENYGGKLGGEKKWVKVNDQN